MVYKPRKGGFCLCCVANLHLIDKGQARRKTGFFVARKAYMTRGKLIKLNKVIGFFYQATDQSNVAVINLAGAPGFGDTGKSKTAKVCNKFGVSYLNPDYIGMCRSDGIFSFKGCVETVYECVDFLTGKLVGTDIEKSIKLPKKKYKKIVLLGSSFGGAIAPFVDKYGKTSIKEIILVAPITNWKGQKDQPSNEPIGEFIRILCFGMKNVWRGFAGSEWPQIIKGELNEFEPIQNTRLLKDKTVMIYHGNKDKSISWRDSAIYFDKIKNEGLAKNVYFEKLVNFGHSGTTVQEGVKRALKKLVSKK